MATIKINHSEVEAYAKSFASNICEKHFADNKEVTGHQLLKLTPVKQINFFVLKLLFESWQEETKKLQSPYFDYKNDKVVKALLSFMNVLSQHISIKKEEFEPLLITAIQESLYLIITPYDYFWAEINKLKTSSVSLKSLSGKSKYIKSNKHIWEGLISKAQSEESERIDKETLLMLLEQLGEQEEYQRENYDDVITKFDDIHPLDIEDLLETEASSSEDEEADVFTNLLNEDEFMDEEPEEDVESATITEDEPLGVAPESEQKEEEDTEEVTKMEQEEETPEEVMPSYKFEATSKMQYQEEEIEEEPESFTEDNDDADDLLEDDEVEWFEEDNSRSEPTLEDEEESPNQLNKKFAEDKRTLHDQLKDKEKVTIADIHESGKKGGIYESISVNQRYMFINELFDNNADLYKEAMQNIEQCESFDDSVELLIQRYAKKMDWNMNSVEVKELLKVIFKRFR